MDAIGNHQLMHLTKTAFLCSRQVPATAVLKCYDWAIASRDAGKCIISGFHSKIERDVLHYLLKGTQPVIVVLARGMKKQIEPEFHTPIEQDRLLIISPFDVSVKRISAQTALKRNQVMVEMADEIVVGHADSKGNLKRLLDLYPDKQVTYL